MSTGILAARRSIPVKPPPNSARPRTSTAYRCTGTAPAPSAEEIDQHRLPYHTAYHEALAAEIRRLQSRHRRVVLTTATRSALSFRDYSTANCRFSTSAPTMVPPARLKWRPSSPTPARCGAGRLQLCRQRPLSRRLDHPPLWRSGKRRPRRPDGTGPARLPDRRSPPWSLDPAKADQLRAVLKPMLHRLSLLGRAPDPAVIQGPAAMTSTPPPPSPRLDNARKIRSPRGTTLARKAG